MSDPKRKCSFVCWLVTASFMIVAVLATLNLTAMFAGGGSENTLKAQVLTIRETPYIANNSIPQNSSAVSKMYAAQTNPWPPKDNADNKRSNEPASQPTKSTGPTEKQMQDFRLLEQKANGQIQVVGPLLREIMTSKEFHLLTEEQRMSIMNEIVTRMNNGELKPEDVYPRGDS